MRKKMFLALVLMLYSFTFSACSDNDSEEDNNDMTEIVEEGSDTAPQTKVDLVGKTVVYNHVSQQYGNTNSLMLTLKFLSATSYSINKDSWFYKWNNGAYRQYHYNETKTGTYSINGLIITMKGNYPFWDGSYSEDWDDEDWQLIFHNNFLTNMNQADPDEPTWFYIK